MYVPFFKHKTFEDIAQQASFSKKQKYIYELANSRNINELQKVGSNFTFIYTNKGK